MAQAQTTGMERDRLATCLERENALSAANEETNEHQRLPQAKSAGPVLDLQRRIQELEDQQRRSFEFLGLLGHELRNPLTPLRNSLHFLTLACGSNADIQESLGIIERQMQVFLRLLDELRELSRIFSGNLQLRKEKTGLAEVIQSASKLCQTDLNAAQQQLSFNLPGESVQVEADVALLVQAFAKLLHNAAKYSEPGGQVTVRSEVGDGVVKVHVIDTGIGIEAGKLNQIFELYRQLNNPRAQKTGGLGIGLTVAREIMQLHGGTIEAKSEGAGKGSDFLVALPVCK
jgi:signal transduction histidine kinase